jgi:hypothetical protein
MQKKKLLGMASSYEAILDLPMDKHPDTHDCIATLVDSELQNRVHRRTQMLLRLSKLRIKIKDDALQNIFDFFDQWNSMQVMVLKIKKPLSTP